MPAISNYRDDLTGENHNADENVNAVLTLRDDSEAVKRDGKPAEFTLTVTAETFKALVALKEGRDGEFREYMAEVLAPKVTRTRVRPSGTSPESTDPATAHLANWLTVNGHEPAAIRQWAKDNGHGEQNARGRLPAEIREAYAKAHGYETPANESPAENQEAPAS